jgi:hypothetical protein
MADNGVSGAVSTGAQRAWSTAERALPGPGVDAVVHIWDAAAPD